MRGENRCKKRRRRHSSSDSTSPSGDGGGGDNDAREPIPKRLPLPHRQHGGEQAHAQTQSSPPPLHSPQPPPASPPSTDDAGDDHPHLGSEFGLARDDVMANLICENGRGFVIAGQLAGMTRGRVPQQQQQQQQQRGLLAEIPLDLWLNGIVGQLNARDLAALASTSHMGWQLILQLPWWEHAVIPWLQRTKILRSVLYPRQDPREFRSRCQVAGWDAIMMGTQITKITPDVIIMSLLPISVLRRIGLAGENLGMCRYLADLRSQQGLDDCRTYRTTMRMHTRDVGAEASDIVADFLASGLSLQKILTLGLLCSAWATHLARLCAYSFCRLGISLFDLCNSKVGVDPRTLVPIAVAHLGGIDRYQMYATIQISRDDDALTFGGVMYTRATTDDSFVQKIRLRDRMSLREVFWNPLPGDTRKYLQAYTRVQLDSCAPRNHASGGYGGGGGDGGDGSSSAMADHDHRAMAAVQQIARTNASTKNGGGWVLFPSVYTNYHLFRVSVARDEFDGPATFDHFVSVSFCDNQRPPGTKIPPPQPLTNMALKGDRLRNFYKTFVGACFVPTL